MTFVLVKSNCHKFENIVVFDISLVTMYSNTSSGKKNNKPRLEMASDQQDNTLNKQSIAMLQLSSTVALGRAVLALSMF